MQPIRRYFLLIPRTLRIHLILRIRLTPVIVHMLLVLGPPPLLLHLPRGLGRKLPDRSFILIVKRFVPLVRLHYIVGSLDMAPG